MRRILCGCGFVSLLIGTMALPIRAQEGNGHRVLILTTGGTIASRRGAPTLDGASLIQAVPQVQNYAEVAVEEFSRVGSSQMTPRHWLQLSRRITALFETDPTLSGVVVTHGTDTMEETAFFLHLTVRDPRPIVLVGSMRSANALSADGPSNLVDAVRIATTPTARGKGVLIAMNGEINSARDAWKTDNQRVQSFRSPELGVLGLADTDAITFYRSTTKPHTTESIFDVRFMTELPRVEIVADYTGFDGSTIDYWIDSGVQGLVVAGFGGGRLSPGATRGVQRAVDIGIPVVVTSRVPGGRITGDPVVPHALVARDLSAQKARILLMLSLSQSRYSSQLREIFETY